MTTKFDPWDWLGVHCGGFHPFVDDYILAFLIELNEYGSEAMVRRQNSNLFDLVATLLCNTDAFTFDENPSFLRFVGDDRFKTLPDLIDAWDAWYGEHYR